MNRIALFRYVSMACLLGSLCVSCASLPAATPAVPPTLKDLSSLSPLRAPTPASGNAQQAIPVISTPKAGLASVRGLLYTSRANAPIPQTVFYLTPAVDDRQKGEPLLLVMTGPDLERGDIRSTSGALGEFSINNVPPGNYYLLVWAPYNWIPAPISDVDDTPRVFQFRPDEVSNLGEVLLSWP